MHERELYNRFGILGDRVVYALEHAEALMDSKAKCDEVLRHLKEVLLFYSELEGLIPRTGDNREIGNIKARLTRNRRGIEEVMYLVELGNTVRASEMLSLTILPASRRLKEQCMSALSLEPNV
ncbi:hypothetical protein [Geomicrobium sediminis]|uniref:Uncharacterized protein n=1 Tax=Geomicrobium sediminis TaxID=1347788 RepID=A0ABS2P7B1_9BACL|nr:hypothetical protein [Geomicrobium sediminis]MBM7631275.1 hypothetical protein [Geomicrobium sediminis]